MRDYTKIEAWRLADDLTEMIYESTKAFPREELYALTSQIRHAASSVPANIVEGSARKTQRDYLRFLHIARGSLAETQYLVHLATRLSYLTEEVSIQLHQQTKQVFACLHGLIKLWNGKLIDWKNDHAPLLQNNTPRAISRCP